MKFWLYMIRVMWRVERGRWYVWRDAPTKIVRQAAALWFFARKDKAPSDGLNSAVLQARAEIALRRAKEAAHNIKENT